MKNSSDPVEAGPDKAAVGVDDLVHSAADAIGPLAEAAAEAIAHAADRVSPLAHAVAERVGPAAHSAADQVGPLAHSAAERIGPLVHTAGEKFAPLTTQAVDLLSPLAHQAVERVSPYAQQAVESVAPYAALAKERGLRAGHDAADRPGPAVGSARDKVSDELLPKVSAALTAAAAAPVVASAVDRGRAALGFEAPVPVVTAPPKKKGRGLAVVAVVAAGAAAAYVVVRKLLGEKGSEWKTARPSAPYVPPSASPAATATAAAEPGSDEKLDGVTGDDHLGGAATADTVEYYGQPLGDVDADETDATAEADLDALTEIQADDDEGVPPVPTSSPDHTDSGPDVPAAGNAALTEGESETADDSTEEHHTAIGGDAPVSTEDDNAAGVGPDAHPGTWSEHGAYVGVEPPEGFFIKANERSMKYHLPESGGYGRTISEIWFSSEEAAQAAGFVRAQR